MFLDSKNFRKASASFTSMYALNDTQFFGVSGAFGVSGTSGCGSDGA